MSSSSSLSDVRSYIESCKTWILDTPSKVDNEEYEGVRQKISANIAYPNICNNGSVAHDIYDLSMFKCFTCSAVRVVRQGQIVIANPFTRSQCIVICAECAQ